MSSKNIAFVVITATGPELASQLNYHSDHKCKTISLCISPCIYWYRQVLRYKEMCANQPLQSRSYALLVYCIALCTGSLEFCSGLESNSPLAKRSPSPHL